MRKPDADTYCNRDAAHSERDAPSLDEGATRNRAIADPGQPSSDDESEHLPRHRAVPCDYERASRTKGQRRYGYDRSGAPAGTCRRKRRSAAIKRSLGR